MLELKKRKKRLQRKKGFLAFLFMQFFLFLLVGCSKNWGQQYQKYSITNYSALNTVSEISIYALEDQQENLEKLNDRLKEWDRLFDIYKNYDGINNLKTINDFAGKKPVKVEERILYVLEKGVKIEQITEGKCNIAFGSVLSLWHKYREEGLKEAGQAKLPTKKELKQAAEHTDISNLVIDKEKQTVYLKDKNMSLDVGAIAKGCAADDIARYAKELGLDSVMINLGGNVLTVGKKKNKTKEMNWSVGIQNPENPNEMSYIVNLEGNQSLVTSGDYQRFYEVDGKRYSHIIDPLTLFPPQKYRSVTVSMGSSEMADALSTTLFMLSLEEGKQLLSKIEKECEVLWILQDGSVEMTEGMKKICN